MLCAPTFSANRLYLERFGLEERLGELNAALVALSREAAGAAAEGEGSVRLRREGAHHRQAAPRRRIQSGQSLVGPSRRSCGFWSTHRCCWRSSGTMWRRRLQAPCINFLYDTPQNTPPFF